MTWLDGSDLQENSLSIGSKLGAGGQGVVHDLQGPGAGYVYKEYLKPAAVNDAELSELVKLPKELTPSESERLLQQSAWPLARVLDGAQVKGFIMRKVPDLFWGRQDRGPKLRELQFLLFEPKPLWGDIVPLDAEGRLEVARQAAALFHMLHSKGLVIGDVSMSNLLWAHNPVGIFLLDCDGIRSHGRRPVMTQPETLDWNDPLQTATGADQDTDRYKLALLVARVLTRSHNLRPGDPLDFVPGLPDRVVRETAARFGDAGRPRGTRPDTGHWIMALSDRGTIDLQPLPPVRRLRALPMAPLDQKSSQRPVIRLTPPAGS
ncbi:hypothetical protein [Streptosporangium sp. NPDC006007]|uniref:hypothetical protein n=1 Tax=Streptosporangium sp. NPDC006007 TaxID=3154575 RepID=UPI0033B39AB7